MLAALCASTARRNGTLARCVASPGCSRSTGGCGSDICCPPSAPSSSRSRQFYAATLVWTVGDVVGLPLVSAVVASMSPADLRGRYQGAQMLAQALAMVAAPLVAGAVIDAFGLRVLWGGCIVIGFAAAVAHALLGAARRRSAFAA